jgi:hypothetical protein
MEEKTTPDGRPLRRYKQRWQVEHTIAWLGNHRRLLVRFERHMSILTGFTLLGCLVIGKRHFYLSRTSGYLHIYLSDGLLNHQRWH